MKTPDILQAKTRALETIANAYDFVNEEIQNITSQIKTKQVEFTDITEKYANIVSEIDVARKAIESDRRNLDSESAKFEQEVSVFNSKKASLKKEQDEIARDIVLQKTTRDSLLKEIENLKLEQSKIKTLLMAKDALISELSSLNESISTKRKENNEAESEYIKITTKMQEEISSYKKELEQLTSEQDNIKSIVYPKLAELDEREKKIAIKENDLKIVEERYKKLYSDVGAGFKI